MYCTWTGIGRQDVRFLELSNDAELIRDFNANSLKDEEALIMKFTFRVNDPMTSVKYYELANQLM